MNGVALILYSATKVPPPCLVGFLGCYGLHKLEGCFSPLFVVQVSVHPHGEARIGMPQAVSNDSRVVR